MDAKRKIGWVLAWGWALAAVASAQIYADFATGAGRFTAELDYERAPRTVAHFIRLAEGRQTWRDPQTGIVRSNAWYEGSAFHRVQYTVEEGVTNLLAVQGGLRFAGGAWSGGTGYGILDEWNNGLSHSNGVLSLVTDGPHTGHAEFMVLTGEGAPYWDGKQTVFGHVVSGMDEVFSIASGATTNGILLAPVALSNVTIRRTGEAALAFSTDRPDLPWVEPRESTLLLSTGQVVFACSQRGQSQALMLHADQVQTNEWAIISMGFHRGTQDLLRTLDVTAAGWSRHFFHGGNVVYPVYSAPPVEEIPGIQFAAEWGNGDVYQYALDFGARTGFYQNVTTTGAVVRINDCFMRTWTGNSIWLNFMDAAGNVFDYRLGFASKGSSMGRYSLSLTSGWTGEFLGAEWGDCQWAPWSPSTTATVSMKSPAARLMPQHRDFFRGAAGKR